jgi:hypothetical protein
MILQGSVTDSGSSSNLCEQSTFLFAAACSSQRPVTGGRPSTFHLGIVDCRNR